MHKSLTPDIAARAIIASAVTLGLDPVEACTSRANPRRQPLAPAAAALADVLLLDADRIATIFGVSLTTMKAHRSHPTRPFLRAKASAEDAIRYALRGAALVAKLAPAPAVSAPEPAPPPRRFIAAALDEATPPKPAQPVPTLSIGGRILAELSARALSTISLSSVLGEKELTVTQALSVLRQEGQVAADQPDERGARHRLWRVAA